MLDLAHKARGRMVGSASKSSGEAMGIFGTSAASSSARHSAVLRSRIRLATSA
jgi:hypothetical protein